MKEFPLIIRNQRGETLEECAARIATERNGDARLYAHRVASVLQDAEQMEFAVFYRMVAHFLQMKGH